MFMRTILLKALLSSLALALLATQSSAWPSDTLTQVQVSPPNVGTIQGIGPGVGGGSVYFWQTRDEGPGVSRLRGLDLDGVPDPSWPDSGLLLETDSRPAQDEILVQGADGSVIVLWMFGGLDTAGASETKIRAQRFRGGQRLWGPSGVIVSRQRQSTSFAVRAAPDGRGGVVVAWGTRENFPSQVDVYLAHVDSNGIHRWAADVPVCEAPGGQFPTHLLLRADGVQVFWGDSRISNAPALYTQRFDSLGAPRLAIDGVRILDHPAAGIGHVIQDGEGGAYFSYGTRTSGSALTDLYLCRIDSTGAAHPSWPSLGVEILAAPTLAEFSAGLTLDSTAHVIAAWYDQRYAGIENSTGGATWLQRFSPDGARMWPQDRLGIAGRGRDNAGGDAIPDGSGGYYLMRATDRAGAGNPTVIRVQHVNASGLPLWRPEAITVAAANSRKEASQFLLDGSGGLFVAWRDNRFGDDNQAIFAQHVNADGSLGGSVTATQASAIASRFEDGCAHVSWHTSESAGIRFEVERARGDESFERIGDAWPDGRGIVTSEDCDWGSVPEQRYRLAWWEGTERRESAPVTVAARAAAGLFLSRPSPMPVGERTLIRYSLPTAAHVRLELHDVAGRRIARLLDEPREAGVHQLDWSPLDESGRRLAPGAYLMTLRVGEQQQIQRVVVTR